MLYPERQPPLEACNNYKIIFLSYLKISDDRVTSINMNFTLQHDSELFGRTLRVNLAKALRLKEGATKPVWADEEWLQMHSGKEEKSNNGASDAQDDNENKEAAAVKRQAENAILGL